MISKKWTECATRAAIAALVLVSTPFASRAAEVSQCVVREEADAFRMRQLQSHLMVAALSCNQSIAYNNFVEHYRPRLAAAGNSLRSYFQRTGGGEPALNRHITQLANVAGLSRAEAPENFCSDTWTMFLLLEEEEEQLPIVAAKYPLSGTQGPQECRAVEVDRAPGSDIAVPVATPTGLPVIRTAAP